MKRLFVKEKKMTNKLCLRSILKRSKKETINKYQFVKHLYENQNQPIQTACKKGCIPPFY